MQGNISQRKSTLRHLWLEITGRCNLTCSHCYAGSGPSGTHGGMTRDDWLRVIDQASEMGVGTIQFIGGEPTLHPDFLDLLRHAATKDARLEVYSNLASIKEEHWATFERLGVSVATSFYSADAARHDAMTGRRGSQARTLRNIEQAVARGIPLRVGVVAREEDDDPDLTRTGALLAGSGVTSVGWDRVRGVGRGEDLRSESSMDALCGNCASSSAAIMPSGDVYPCIMARTVSTGNVRSSSLAEVLNGASMERRLADLRNHFARRPSHRRVQRSACGPQGCSPYACRPQACGPDACNPDGHPPCRPFEREKPYDPGRPVDIDPYEKSRIKDKTFPKIKTPKINPDKNKPS